MKFFIEKYKKHKELAHNFFWRILQIFGKQGIIFFIFFLCAKLLSPYDFGVYNYVLVVVLLLVVFCDFGISTSTSKFISEFNSAKNEKIKLILFNSFIPIFAISLVVFLAAIFFGEYFLGDKYRFVFYVLPLLFLMPISSLYDGVFRGLKRFKELAIFSSLAGFLSIFFVYFLVKNYGLEGALISQNLFYLILIAILFLRYRDFSFRVDQLIMRRLTSYAFLVGLANMGYFLYTKTNSIILGKAGYIVETGYYGFVDNFFSIAIMLFSIFGHVIAPDNIKIAIDCDMDRIKKRVKKIIFITPVVGCFIAALFYLLVPVVIKRFFLAYDKVDFFNIFHIFLLVIPLAVTEALLSNGFITPLGHVKILTKIVIIGGVLSLISNIVFLHYFGYLGAILSMVIVFNVVNSFKIFLFWKKINKLSC